MRCWQDLTQTAWALAKFASKDLKLLSQIAEEAQRKMGGFAPQHLSELAWAYSKLGRLDEGLLHQLSTQVTAG